MMTETPSLPPALPLGPCEKPCGDEPCHEGDCEGKGKQEAGRLPLWQRFMKTGLFNTLDLCFDDVYSEPKKILIVGGCRQRDLAQHIALLLPAAEIVLIDPDEAEVRAAEEEICCRFKFITSPLEALPFEDEAFDLTLAHHFAGYAEQWPQALSEISRVTRKNLFLSVQNPLWIQVFKLLPGFSKAMQALGTVPAAQAPSRFDLLSRLRLYAKVKTRLAPLPWTVYMTEMRPDRQEKTVLS